MLSYLIKFRYLSTIVAMSILWLSFQPLATAEMISTEAVLSEQQSVIDRAAILSALDRDELKRALILNGVDPVYAKQRVISMTDDEVLLLNQKIEDLPVGGDASTLTLIFILYGIVIIGYLLLIFMDD